MANFGEEKEVERGPEKPDSPQVKEVKDDLGTFKAIEAITHQEGGKILMSRMKDEIRDDIESILSLARGAEMDLRTAVIKLKADLNLYRVLKRSKANVRLAEEELSKLLEDESEG